MNNNQVISILKNLIDTCRRGQYAFRNAAESTQNSEVRRLFNIFSQQRAQFAVELQSELHRLGGAAEDSGERLSSVRSSTHWSASMPKTVRDEATVIAECQCEEETAVNDYQEALKTDLPLDVQYVVKRQYMDIKDAYDRIRILQRAA
jgi:uncharacterized protein (TIGR02284 family)